MLFAAKIALVAEFCRAGGFAVFAVTPVTCFPIKDGAGLFCQPVFLRPLRVSCSVALWRDSASFDPILTPIADPKVSDEPADDRCDVAFGGAVPVTQRLSKKSEMTRTSSLVRLRIGE